MVLLGSPGFNFLSFRLSLLVVKKRTLKAGSLYSAPIGLYDIYEDACMYSFSCSASLNTGNVSLFNCQSQKLLFCSSLC